MDFGLAARGARGTPSDTSSSVDTPAEFTLSKAGGLARNDRSLDSLPTAGRPACRRQACLPVRLLARLAEASPRRAKPRAGRHNPGYKIKAQAFGWPDKPAKA
jgi:hypothetical protein